MPRATSLSRYKAKKKKKNVPEQMLFVEGEAEKVGSSGEFGRTETEKKNKFVDVVQQIT